MTGKDIVISDAGKREIALLTGGNMTVLVTAEDMTIPGRHALRHLRTVMLEKRLTVDLECHASHGMIALLYQHFSGNAVAHLEIESNAGKMFESIVYRAGQANASDIHIVIKRNDAQISFRIHGELEVVEHWTRGQAEAMCSCAYTVIAEIKDTTWVPERRQDANFAHIINGRLHRIRYSHHPIYPDGVHIVMRILSTGRGIAFVESLCKLGYNSQQADTILAMVAEPSGMLVISGETGSGKSTTLANLIHILLLQSNDSISLQTVEDPPEYEVPGAIQTPVIHSRNDLDNQVNPYVEAIKSAMRCDPDILVVGEIRDLDTARLAAAASESGHPVLTTLHASRALNIVARLSGFGSSMPVNPVNRALLCAPQFLAGLVHQTLIPVLCDQCAIPFADAIKLGLVDDGLKSRVMAVSNGNLEAIRARGPSAGGGGKCPHCRNGIIGRTVCAEAIIPEPRVLKLLLDNRDQEAFDTWLENGGYSIRDHAIDKMMEGLLSPADVEASLGRLRIESKNARRQQLKSVANRD